MTNQVGNNNIILKKALESVNLGGAFLTQVELNTNALKKAQQEYSEELGEKFMKNVIRKDIKISDIEKEFRPILCYCPNTNAVFDYSNLILEMNILDSNRINVLKKSIGLE